MADHAHDHHHARPNDRRAAFTGLILGALFVGGVLFSVVKLTQASFANEKGGHEAAAETK